MVVVGAPVAEPEAEPVAPDPDPPDPALLEPEPPDPALVDAEPPELGAPRMHSSPSRP